MEKSRLTLIVDGNWLLMSRWAVLNNKYSDDAEMCRDLQLMMIKSLNVVLRTFPSIDNIIFVSDGGSWRNDLPIPLFLEDEYKGNREQDPNINWAMIFSYYEELISLFNENNINTCKVKGIEGDDWCWYWSNKLNNEGTNVIIWSMDKDLTQLVKTDETTGIFTICWNKNYTTIQDADYSNGSDLDFFFGDIRKESNQQCLHEIISKSTKINKINPKSVVIDKIIRGDKGDNIFPIMNKKSKTNPNKKFRVSPKDLDFNLDIYNDNDIKKYISNIMESKSYKNNIIENSDQIFEHFKYNVKLVALEKQNYSNEILSYMNSYMSIEPNKNIVPISSYITAKTNKLSNVLDII